MLNRFSTPVNTQRKKILFAFSSDQDVAVNAVELLTSLQCKPIADMNTICGKIMTYFASGLGSELYITQGFEQIVELADSIKTYEDLGGNAAQMALRAFKEGADVYLHSVMSKKYYRSLFNESITIVPSRFLRDKFTDVHLVINYNEGDEYMGVKCPRNNRLYLQNDQDNTQFPGLDTLAQEIKNIQPDLLVVGGFQLMNQMPRDQHQEIILKLERLLNTVELKVHFEMGAFTDKQLFEFLIEHVLHRVDSIGMNEQELTLLHNFMRNGMLGKENVNQTVNQQVQMAVEVFDMLPTLSRIHFHTEQIQMICSDDKWDNIEPALFRSIIVGLIHAMKDKNDNLIDYAYYGDMNLQVMLTQDIKLYPTEQLITAEQLTTDQIACWNTSKLVCCIAPTLIHDKPKRTCGLGDNIGATSLLYQL